MLRHNNWATPGNPHRIPLPRTAQEWRDSATKCSRFEAQGVAALLAAYDVSPTVILGDGYAGPTFLSKYAAGQVAGLVELWVMEEEAREAEAKRAIHTAFRIAEIAAPSQTHPVFRCPTCRGSRPHTHVGGWQYRCDSCGTREDVSV